MNQARCKPLPKCLYASWKLRTSPFSICNNILLISYPSFPADITWWNPEFTIDIGYEKYQIWKLRSYWNHTCSSVPLGNLKRKGSFNIHIEIKLTELTLIHWLTLIWLTLMTLNFDFTNFDQCVLIFTVVLCHGYVEKNWFTGAEPAE